MLFGSGGHFPAIRKRVKTGAYYLQISAGSLHRRPAFMAYILADYSRPSVRWEYELHHLPGLFDYPADKPDMYSFGSENGFITLSEACQSARLDLVALERKKGIPGGKQ